VTRPTPPSTDDDVASWARDLGLPGIADVHTHFLPPRMLRRVWEYFAAPGPLVGREWPVAYKWAEEELVAHLGAMGVRRFSALAYAHRPQMAADLNDWTLDFAARVPGCLPSMTFYPEPGVETYVDTAIDRGARIAKLHLQAAEFDPADPLLDAVWGRMAELALPVVVHAGSGPVAHGHTGPGPLEAVLRRHPRLVVVVAHCGAPEYEGFVALARRFEGVCLDTTMVGTDFFGDVAPMPRALLPELRALGLDGRVLLGSDFPNIPYPYAHQLEALHRWGLGDAWLRAVCWHNAAALLPIDRPVR
jgi:predicted TIM-barrel fold metal-dependent hydrolase